jgi:dTDP-4-dehydrorhamnose reductase
LEEILILELISMDRVLVLGSTGMAGHVISLYLERLNRYIVDNISHSSKLNDKSVQLDLTEIDKLESFLKDNNYDYIINCVGVLNQFADRYKDKAILLNSYLPRYLEKRFTNTNTKIIHLSTDCVFSGKAGAYTEASFRDGDTFYDRTKILGELDNSKDLTIRTSIIGPDINNSGIGLFNWFMKSSGNINGYTKAFWSGITTIELAKAIVEAIEQNICGLYHVVPENKISKYELLCLFKEIFQREKVAIDEYENFILDKSLINTRTDFAFKVKNYRQMVEEMKAWVDENKELYKHYS